MILPNRLFCFVFFSVSFFAASALQGGDQPPPERVKWLTYEQALQLAREKSRPVIIVFCQDHCRKCEMLEKNGFNRPDIAAYVNSNFAAVKINVKDRPDLKAKFRVASCPMVWFLTPEAREIDYFVGYVPPERLLLILRYVGDGVYKVKSFAEYEKEQKGR